MSSPKEQFEKRKKMSNIMKKKWEDAEFREEMCKTRSNIMIEKWKDPEYRTKQEKERKQRRGNVEWREKISVTMKQIAQNPEWREAIAERNRSLFEDPAYYERHMKMLDNTKEQRSNKMKKNWDNPKFVYKVMEARHGKESALNYIEKKFSSLIRDEMEALNENL
ncbi:MAG: hypothetical protein Q8M92_01175 [Candidatus Subteraquimicrobiales bacterium]|nr:hypothetical protein [Candidatus Subteraquimicrobiales bacterium]